MAAAPPPPEGAHCINGPQRARVVLAYKRAKLTAVPKRAALRGRFPDETGCTACMFPLEHKEAFTSGRQQRRCMTDTDML